MVKVYIADATVLNDEQLYRRLYTGLDVSRRAKADRFRFEKDKRLSVAAGALLQYALQMENVREPSIYITPNGKPYLAGEERLYFNLSHSEGMVMCAIAEKEVGCDVEKKAALDCRLAEYVMTEYELSRIYGLERETEQQEMFFRLWTLKESYMKATGLGIRLEPKSFGMIARKDKIEVAPPVDGREFYFKEYFEDDGYCYSCCSLSEKFCDTMTEVALGRI
ncbi:MAG: 4'-phosphopantetheinyl transferase family protein [Lachnospiraceae bacterium]